MRLGFHWKRNRYQQKGQVMEQDYLELHVSLCYTILFTCSLGILGMHQTTFAYFSPAFFVITLLLHSPVPRASRHAHITFCLFSSFIFGFLYHYYCIYSISFHGSNFSFLKKYNCLVVYQCVSTKII